MVLRSEEEMMAKWAPNAEPLVSIRCTAFKQEQYIAECIEGFLIQETSFPFEVCIHDDASPDRTADIIREYEAKYPHVIKALCETENQWSKNDGSFTRIISGMLTRKYIAMCEGDDYWTDPHKLQRQVDFLESHPEYSLSAENGNVLFTETGVLRPFSNEPERDISLDELLIKRRFPTASVLFRREHLLEYLEQDAPRFDTSQWAFLATKGKIHYDPVISSVYRRGSGVTENNRIRWAYTSEEFNDGINQFYKPNKKVRKARKRTLYYDYKNGWKAAKAQKNSKEARKLLLRMISKTPFLFLRDLIKSKGSYYTKKFITKYWNIRYSIMPVPKLRNNKKNTPVIVSLTSYPARFNTLHLVIKSLLNQSLQPDKVVLYLDKTVSLENVPSKVLKLQKKGLVIRNICDDIKPHKKYFYAMQEYPDAAIITVDDDVIYAKDTVSSLYSSFLKNPEAVSARRVHQISRGLNGESMPYNTWTQEVTHLKKGDKDLISVGIGGVLYPPKIFDFSKPYFQLETIIEQCLKADDIWLAFIERVNNIPICPVPNKLPHPYKITDPVLKETALRNQNVFENQNDIYIQRCRDYFGIDL